MTVRPIVVGVDGSGPSLAAADQAATLAVARHAPLKLVHGYLHPGGYGSSPLEPYAGYPPPPPEAGDLMLAELSKTLRTDHPDLAVTYEQPLAGGAPSLISESRQAQLVVVGCRGRGGFAGLLLGSVSTQLVAHAHCPVLVVRPAEPTPPPAEAPVLVGVDGSASSSVALEYAAAEASRRGRALLVVNAGKPGADERRAHAEALLAEALHEVKMLHPDLSVDGQLLTEGTPAEALVEVSKQASVAVVGSRGRGGFAGLLLGSVSQALVHHAHCPVLVIPPKAAASLPAAEEV